MNKIKTILNFLERRYGMYINNSVMKNQEIFELLIETVLSQRTRDESSEKAANNLFKVARTPKQILKLPMKKLQSLIRISGTYKQKSKRIKQMTKIILEKYNGKVPNKKEELMELPGVGHKTSAIVLMYGFNKPAIAVDVHVEVCSKRLDLVPENSEPSEVEIKLEKIFPLNKWYVINMGFVMFGKEICLTRKPRCNICHLLKICPYGLSYGIKRFQK
jgi:endonuclease-3